MKISQRGLPPLLLMTRSANMYPLPSKSWWQQPSKQSQPRPWLDLPCCRTPLLPAHAKMRRQAVRRYDVVGHLVDLVAFRPRRTTLRHHFRHRSILPSPPSRRRPGRIARLEFAKAITFNSRRCEVPAWRLRQEGPGRPTTDGDQRRWLSHQLRSFCLLYAAFRLNALLWNGGQHGCRILDLGRYHCLWHLDRRWHDRRWLAFGLDAHGTTYRHCGFDQPLSNNWRCQNRVAVRGPEPSTWTMLLMGSRG